MKPQNILLDTSFVIGKKEPITIQFDANGRTENLYVSVITLGELSDEFVLDSTSKSQQKIKGILRNCGIIELRKNDKNILDTYARLSVFMKTLTMKNKQNKDIPLHVGQNDIWIVASAIVKNMLFFTNDKRQEHLYLEFVKTHNPTFLARKTDLR